MKQYGIKDLTTQQLELFLSEKKKNFYYGHSFPIKTEIECGYTDITQTFPNVNNYYRVDLIFDCETTQKVIEELFNRKVNKILK